MNKADILPWEALNTVQKFKFGPKSVNIENQPKNDPAIL